MPALPVLTYHCVASRASSGIASFTVAPGVFRTHLDLLAELGVRVLSARDLTEAIARNDPLPERSAVITFDDGFRDNLDAFALLRDRGLPATLFVCTGLMDGIPSRAVRLGPMLGPDDLAPIKSFGVDLGAHGHDHAELDVLPRREAAADIRRSRSLLTEWIGEEPALFAYPYGFNRVGTRRLVEQAGFRGAFGVGNRLATEADSHWAVSRLLVERSTTVAELRAWLGGAARRSTGRDRVSTVGFRAVRWTRRRLPGRHSRPVTA